MNDPIHQAKLAHMEHIHRQKVASIHAAAAGRAALLHKTGGPQAVHAALSQALQHGGVDRDFIRGVGHQLRMAGHNELADLHDYAASE